MAMNLILRIELLSDASFGRGDGLAGLVDSEVEHDPRTGLPFIRGRVIKGLLVEECANLLFALSAQKHSRFLAYEQAAKVLFGSSAGGEQDEGSLHVGPAVLPKDLQTVIVNELEQKLPKISAAQVLESLTGIRRQTAMDDGSGAPEDSSLRAVRVMLRGLVLEAHMYLDSPLTTEQQELLAACVLATRRGGLARSRGRGKLKMSLIVNDHEETGAWFSSFKQQILERAQ